MNILIHSYMDRKDYMVLFHNDYRWYHLDNCIRIGLCYCYTLLLLGCGTSGSHMICIDNIHQSTLHHRCKQIRWQKMDSVDMNHIHMDLDSNDYNHMCQWVQYCYHHNTHKHQFYMVSNHNNLDFHLNMGIVLDSRHNNCLGGKLVHLEPYIPYEGFKIVNKKVWCDTFRQ